ncbi:MAG: Bicarbonate transporter BicA [Candidatus Synechococcus spongiarum 15L]|uniref:Bicarbonate transporter BicA n=1 Tax=Candidatus Synechococcus spongiarum 15L TaxID=1608419 RepID=A0A0G8AU93_9SYNE|nr:MAG: Bicarbonate transporter BicA [Candidatus Synechococcus spongiarum 15L]
MANLKFLAPHGLHGGNLRGDLSGGVTAAVVALPLALAFGNAALGEGGAVYGLYGAVVVGFFAALFGGTPSQVSGPTGPMSVAVAGVVATLAELGVNQDMAAGELLPLVMAAVVLGGLFQILFGLLRLGRYVTLVPYSVVSGFMSGIGVIILLLQAGPFIGINTRGGVVDSLAQLHQHFTTGGGPNLAATGIGAMTLAVVFLTPKRIAQLLPSPLLALLLITPISLIRGENVPRIGLIPEGGLHLTLPAVGDHWGALVQAGLILAVLGSIDSLLTSLVADSLTQTQHRSDRELIGQGIGNSLAGLFSGLPGAGATMRTVINVKSGGKTPLSGMIHSLTLLLVLMGAGPMASQIPNALLAGILAKVGIDIIDWNFLFRAHRISTKTAGVMYGVLLMTVFWDLIWAVLVGIFVANLMTMESITAYQLEGMDAQDRGAVANSDLPEDERTLLDACGGHVMVFRLSGPLSFGAAKGISDRMSLVRNYKVLILDLSTVARLGVTAALAIESMLNAAAGDKRHVFLIAPEGRVRRRLERLNLQDRITGDLSISRKAALQRAVDLCRP